jgi:bla regulator protein BlaR1
MNEVSLWYSPILEALGYAIFHSLWQSVLLFFPLQLVLLICKKSQQRYRILYGGLTLLFLVFIVTFCIEWNDAIQLQKQHLLLAKTAHSNSAVISNFSMAWKSSNQWWQSLIGFYRNAHFRQTLPIISICYVSGILFMGFRMLLAVKNIKTIRKNVLPISIELQQKFSALVNLVGISRKVSLFFSDNIQVPLMLGHLKPIVILPVALINQLDWQQTEAILLHELAHAKRMDYLFNILQNVMEVFMFFNPMTWWFSSIIRKEREHCCDDIAVLHSKQPVKYAEALLQLELSRNQYSPAMAATGNNKKYSLLNRIKRIVEMKTTSKRSPQSMLAALTSLIFIAAFFCYYTAIGQEQKKEMPKKEQEESVKQEKTEPSPETVSDQTTAQTTATDNDDDETITPEMEAVVKDALKQANVALSQVDWKEINGAMKEARTATDKIDMKEIEQSMKEAREDMQQAQKEMASMDWTAVNNSLSLASDALKGIDWNAVGDNISTSMQSLDETAFTNAMKEAKDAMQGISVGNLKIRGLSKSQADSLKEWSRKVREENKAKFIAGTNMRKEALDAARQQRQVALAESNKQRHIILATRQKEVREARETNDNKPERLLKKLEQKGLINRNDKFKISYKNNQLKVNGQVISTQGYEQYLPTGEDASLNIAGKKNNLSVTLKQ